MTTQTELERLKAAAYAAWAAERVAYAAREAARAAADAAWEAARAKGNAADAAWEAAYVRSTHKRLSRKKVQS